MFQKLNTKVVLHSFNGNEDDVQFVEVDGVRYVPDAEDNTKPKEENGEKVKYVEPEPEKPEDKPEDVKDLDLSKMTTAEIAALNPEVKQLLEDKAKREADDAKAIEDKKREEGKHEEIIKDKDTEIEDLKKQLGTKGDILEKYVGSVKTMLEAVMKDIPEANRGLVPDGFSPREKLEYITKNAKVLGVKVGSGKAAGVDPNETDPNSTDLQKLNTEFEELQKKENKTGADYTRMQDLGKKIKEERAKKKD